MKNTYYFLKLLKQNNNRNWFNQNKELYLIAKQEFEQFLEQLIQQISQFEPQLSYLTPKDTMFRIYRDIRFSKDKRPYKEYFCAFLAYGGKKSQLAGYYIHIEPDNTFAGGGVYCPKPEILNPIRWHIYENIDRFLEIINNQDFKSTFGEIYGDKLKKPPRGFPKDFPHIDLLKYKSYAITTKLPDNPDINLVIATFKKMKAFNDFLNEAILKSWE